jgi:hypothetical protein
MKKFDYKKWIVENKYGKAPSYSSYQGSGTLNEQMTFGDYNYGDVSPQMFPLACPDGLNASGPGTGVTGDYCTTCDICPDALAGDIDFWQNQTVNWVLNVCCTGSSDSSWGGSEPTGSVTGSGEDTPDDFGPNEWDPNLTGSCDNFDNLPSDMQTLACQAYNNLGDTNNPSLTMWVQSGNCCGNEATGSASTGSEGQPGPQGMPSAIGSKRKDPPPTLPTDKKRKEKLKEIYYKITKKINKLK